MQNKKKTKPKSWNVPNWHEISGYEYINKLSADAIRWEFLRRSWLYRHEWNSGDYSSELDFGLRKMLDPEMPGNKLPANFQFADSNRLGAQFSMGERVLDREYIKNFSGVHLEEGLEEKIGEYVVALVNRGYALFVFDPNIKAESQMNRAKKVLSAIQKKLLKAPTDSKREIILLLRVMDACNEIPMRRNKRWNHGEKIMVAREILSSIKNVENITSKMLDEKYGQACAMASRSAL